MIDADTSGNVGKSPISFDEAGVGIGAEDDDIALQALGDDSNPMVRSFFNVVFVIWGFLV